MISFYYPLAALLIIPVSLFILYYVRPREKGAILLVASKLVIIFIILLGFASPYTENYTQGGATEVTIIADRTESMRMFSPGTPEEVYSFLRNLTSVTVDTISGTRSPIGEAVIRNVKSGGSILLISDGNNNYGKSLPDAVMFARSLNATVYSLKQVPVKKDMSVSIDSDTAAVVDSPADFHVNINTVGSTDSDLKVWIDNNLVFNDHITSAKRIPLTYTFHEPGSHTMKAELSVKDDELPQNSVFYRSVHVVPVPGVLLVSKEESPLFQIMKRSYSVSTSAGPEDAGRYKAVVLDDISAKELSSSEALILSDYVMNGGGLVVVGGSDAYADYGIQPLFEQLIPVKPGGVPPRASRTAVVVVVDISGSTGELTGSDLKLGIEKGLALQVMEAPGERDFIGVIAFNNAPHVIVPFAQYADRSDAEDTVMRLRYGGTTQLAPALAAARDMLKGFEGGRNVVVISDGAVADAEAASNTARLMSGDGITVYTIGVGADTDEAFMERLAGIGGGGYLERDAAGGIKVLFAEMEDRNKGDGYPLVIINSGHFITRDLTLNATVYGYNNVFAKQNAQVLVMTGNGAPAVTTWRAGLGRVVAITVDNGNSWAPALYSRDNSKLISASLNYAIGNPQGIEVRAEDGEVGEPIDVFVSSGSEPGITFDGALLQFKKAGEGLYHASVLPDSTGFHDLSGYSVAVNEPSEYWDTGNNELMEGIITAAGGRAYNRSELGELIHDMAGRRGQVRRVVDLQPVFFLAALLLYVTEVVLRRLMEVVHGAPITKNS